MYLQKFFWFLINFYIILVDFQVFCNELRLVGSSDLGIQPKDAQRICQKIGGDLAILTEETQKFYAEKLFKNCSTDSDFCSKMCVWEKVPEFNGSSFEKKMMTQPVYLGDTLHFKLEVKENTMEVFQISDYFFDDLKVNATTPQKVQNVILQLVIYNKYINTLEGGKVKNEITVGSGTVKKLDARRVENKIIPRATIKMNKLMNETMELKLEFTENQMLRISSLDLPGANVQEYEVGKLNGRMYFEKLYDDFKILAVYFTRGNCSKSNFYHFPDNKTQGFVNCHWTRPSVSIPVYSCRKASFVACSNVPLPSTTTPNPTTSKVQKKKNKKKKNEDNIAENLETFDDSEEYEPIEGTYFHVEFLDEHIMFFVTLSGMSVTLLIGSIVLQGMKMWQNRKLKIVKKKKK